MHSFVVDEMQLSDGKQLIGLIMSTDFVHVLGPDSTPKGLHTMLSMTSLEGVGILFLSIPRMLEGVSKESQSEVL